MGTTTDKLNYLSETKELLRQGINNTGAGELLTSSNTFMEYVTALEEHPYYLECLVEGIITDCKVSSVVRSIRDYAFYYCLSLTSVSFPNAVGTGRYAFQNCTELTSASFPNATSIRDYTFDGCSKLNSTHFPKVTSIGSNAFYNCTSLTSASFPDANNIGYAAFKGCSSLTTLYVGTNRRTVCTLSNTNAIPSTITRIYVTSSLVNSYKSATNWSSFADKIVAYTG